MVKVKGPIKRFKFSILDSKMRDSFLYPSYLIKLSLKKCDYLKMRKVLLLQEKREMCQKLEEPTCLCCEFVVADMCTKSSSKPQFTVFGCTLNLQWWRLFKNYLTYLENSNCISIWIFNKYFIYLSSFVLSIFSAHSVFFIVAAFLFNMERSKSS